MKLKKNRLFPLLAVRTVSGMLLSYEYFWDYYEKKISEAEKVLKPHKPCTGPFSFPKTSPHRFPFMDLKVLSIIVDASQMPDVHRKSPCLSHWKISEQLLFCYFIIHYITIHSILQIHWEFCPRFTILQVMHHAKFWLEFFYKSSY